MTSIFFVSCDLEEEDSVKNNLAAKKIEDHYTKRINDYKGEDTLLTISLIEEKNKVINQIELGKDLYQQHCSSCHMKNGKGVPGIYPPLDASDYMLADMDRTIKTILYGSNSSIIVNGIKYPGSIMTPFSYMTDMNIAAITNYIINSWTNNGGVATLEMIKSNRQGY